MENAMLFESQQPLLHAAGADLPRGRYGESSPIVSATRQVAGATSMQTCLRALKVAAAVLLLGAWSGAARCAPETGWWWNPAESGRGFFVESDGEITFIGAYFYEADGHATWLVAGGPNTDPYNFTGQLYALSNGQTLFGSYVVPGAANYAGTLSVHFTDDAHASITWPGGTIAVERQIFSRPAESSFRPIPGWWWNPDESGTGYSIEVQGDQLFLVGFMYDDSGRPVWYFSAGPMASATTYRGSILQFANGQTMGGTYHPPGTPVSIGILDIEFTANDAAEFTFSEAPGATAEAFAKIAQLKLKVGKTRKDKGKPQFPRVFPLVYGNQFSLTQTLAAGPMTVTRTFVGNASWKLQGKDVGPNARAYKVNSGAVRITVETTIGVPGGVVCKGSGVRTFDAKTVFKTSEVTVFDLNTNSVPKNLTDWNLRFDITDALMPITAICTAPGGGTTTSTTMVLENFGFHDFGMIQNRTGDSSTPATGSFSATVNNIVPTERTTGFIDFFVTSSSP